MLKKILSLCCVLLLLTACDKSVEKAPETCKEGYIRWGHEPELDGIGWYFAESGDGVPEPYKFDNLPEAFKKDSTAVAICFTPTSEKFPCFCGTPLKVYHLTSIEKR